ncbi:MAG: glycosyltransferase family 8 protein [Gemmatimonadales bacterium]
MRGSRDDRITVACAANGAYAMPLAVMLRSAAENLRADRHLLAYVVDDGIGSGDKRRISDSLPGNTSVEWVAPARTGFSGLPLWGRMPVTTYDKMMVAQILPRTVKKVIWLDSDVLVLGDLTELWNSANGAHTMAARDSLVPSVASRFGIAAYRDLGLPPDSQYFNAGMMVIDADLWRTDEVSRRALEYLRKYRGRVFFWDQEALNAVLAGKWKPADARWNWSASTDRVRGSTSLHLGPGVLPSIIHFNGRIKPWTVHDATEFTALWFRFLDRTAWKGWRPSRTLRRSAVAWYASSPVRSILYPAEQWWMHLTRLFTRRYA